MRLYLRFGRARRLPGFDRLSACASPPFITANTGGRPDAITTARQPPSQEPYLRLCLPAASPDIANWLPGYALGLSSEAPSVYRLRPLGQRRPAFPIYASRLFLKAISDTIQRFDHVEFVVAGFELFTQPFDVAVDGAVVDIDLIVISRIHQGVAAFHHARAARQGLQDQKLGHGERHRLVFPGAGVTLRIHAQQAPLEHLAVSFLWHAAVFGRGAAQHGFDALDQ